MTSAQKNEIFNMCHPKNVDKWHYYKNKANEQLKNDGFYSKKVANLGKKANYYFELYKNEN